MFPPEGAITKVEDLEVIIILGLPVEHWDVDMNTIRERYPTAIKAGQRGLIIDYKDGMGQYAKWHGFNDPTYNVNEVLASMSDDELDKAVAPASMYIFNTRTEAVAAQKAHAHAQALKRKLRPT